MVLLIIKSEPHITMDVIRKSDKLMFQYTRDRSMTMFDMSDISVPLRFFQNEYKTSSLAHAYKFVTGLWPSNLTQLPTMFKIVDGACTQSFPSYLEDISHVYTPLQHFACIRLHTPLHKVVQWSYPHCVIELQKQTADAI